MNTLIHTTDVVILTYFLALNTFYALLLVLAIPEIWEQTRLAEDEDFQRLMQSDALPPITILVPAYNESATIETSVTAILTLEYRNFEIVVVNDGSKDDTMERLRQAFFTLHDHLYPDLDITEEYLLEQAALGTPNVSMSDIIAELEREFGGQL